MVAAICPSVVMLWGVCMSSQGTWDISFLVDEDGRILEGRGACNEHLGETLQVLIGRSLTGIVALPEQKYLRRFLAQLNRPNAKRAVIITLQSLTHGTRAYAMQAQPGRSGTDHWLLFSHTTEQADSFDSHALPPAMADDGQFLRLVEMAAAQAGEALELTTIAVAGLAQAGRTQSGAGAAKWGAFAQDVGETLATHAYEGILSNPAPGQYNLLHDPAQSGEAIAADLSTLAIERGISAAEAGIAHASVEVAPNAKAADIRAALATLQTRLPASSWDAPPPQRTRGQDGQFAALLGIGAFVIGIIAVAFWILAGR
jgi:hypothetical protein